MASTYSTNLAFELPGTGDQAGTWGITNNTNIGTLIEQAISGYVTQAVSTGTDTTITIPNGSSGVARNMTIELTGTGGTNTNLIVPANRKLYFIFNNTSSGQVTVKVSGQTGVSVPNGQKMVLVCNGTDVVTAVTYAASMSLGSLTVTGTTTLSGLTASTALALDASKNVVSVTNSGTGNNVLATSPTLVTPTLGAASATSVAAALGAVGTPSYTFTGDLNTGMWSPAADTLAFSEGGVEAMRINSSGNVGIGTASWPSGQRLRVAGGDVGFEGQYFYLTNANANIQMGAAQNAQIINSDSGNLLTISRTGASSAMAFSTAGSERMRLDSSGNLGIGTASPTARLDLGSLVSKDVLGLYGNFIGFGISAGAMDIYTSSTGVITFNQRNGATFTEHMRLTSTGLGIGTASPSVKLEVNGQIRTEAPTGGTAANWRLGTVHTVSPTSPNRTIEVDIGGTIYYLHAKTTNN